MGMFDDLLSTPAPQQAAPQQSAASVQSSGLFDDLLSTPAAAPQQAPQQDPIRAMVNAAAVKYQLDPELFNRQIDRESKFNPRAVSHAGAMGLGQLMPGTAKDLGVTDPFDPAQNVEGAAKYMRQLLDRYGQDYDKALSAYNWGMGNVDKFGTNMRPKETREYTSYILGGQARRPGAAPQSAVPKATDLQTNMETFERQALEQGWRGADYLQRKTKIINDYKKAGGKLPSGYGVEDMTRGFGQGLLSDMNTAGNQLVSAVLPDTIERAVMPGGKTFNEKNAEDEKALEEYRQATGEGGMDWARLAGNVLNPAGMAAGATGAVPRVLANLGPKTQAAAMAAMRGGLGAATAPVTPEDDGSILAPKAAQVATGVVAGPVLDVLGRGARNVAGRVAGAVKGKFATPEIQLLDKLAKKHNIPLNAGDLDRNRRIVRGLEAQLMNSRVPGLGIDLRPQQAAGLKAAQELLDMQRKELSTLTYQNLDSIRQIAASGGKRAKEAQTILDMIDEAGDDARRAVRASGNLGLLRKKITSDANFDEVERLAGNADINPMGTLKALGDALKQAEAQTDKDQAYIGLLNRWILDLNSDPAVTGVPNSFMKMRDFRSSLKARKDDATNAAGLLDNSKTSLNDVIKAVEGDMDRFVDSTGNQALKRANEKANNYYRENVASEWAKSVAKAVRNDNPDKVWGTFVRTGSEWKGDTMQQRLYQALDDKGKSAVRAGIVEQAFKEATSPEGFSATEFNKVLRSAGYETFFRGEGRTQLNGLMMLMDHMERSDPAKLAQFQPMLALGLGGGIGGAVLGTVAPSTVALGLAGTGAMKWFLTSEAGKRLLHSANIYKPGTPAADKAMTKILESARNQFTAAGSRAASLEAGKPGTVLP